MLEEDFNELDDDFITLWSCKILTNNTSKIMPPLKQLAEQGQINAIQSYYLLKKDDENNEVINSIVEGYYGDSFNEALAIANKLYSESKKELKQIKEQMLHYCDLDRKYKNKFYETHYVEENCDSPYEKELNRLLEVYRNTPYAQAFKKAVELGRFSAESTQRARFWQRYFEVLASDKLISEFDRESLEKGIKILRKNFIKHLKKNPDSSVVKYSLGKNYIFFGKNAVEKFKGTKILEELASRPLVTCSYSNQEKTL